MSLATIERVEIVGLKSSDGEQALEARALVTGPVGSGKSRISDALRFAALGYVPAQGKREVDTARLMRGAEMRTRVVLGDGRWFERSLTRKGQTFRSAAQASWLPVDANTTEHGEAIRALFGSSDLEAEESLDLRALLAASPNERARRIEALLDATAMTPADQASLLYALPVYRLAGMALERVPASPTEAEGLAVSLAQTLLPAQRDALAAANATARQTLVSRGTAEALAEAGRSKNAERDRVRGKTQARKEVEDRQGPAPSVTLDALREQRQQRTDRLAQLRAQVAAHADARKAREEAEKAEREAQAALDAVLAEGDPSERAAALGKAAEEARAEAVRLIEPPVVPAPVAAEEDAAVIEQALQLEEQARELDERAAASSTPYPAARPIAPVPAIDYSGDTEARRVLAQADANPWQVVREHAKRVDLLTLPLEQQEARALVSDGLRALAQAHGGPSVEDAMEALRAVNEAIDRQKEAVAAVKRANAEAEAANAADAAAWAKQQNGAQALRVQAVEARAKATTLRGAELNRVGVLNAKRRAAYRTASAERAAAADAVAQRRKALNGQADDAAAAGAALLRDWTAKAAALATARAKVDGIAVAAPIDLDGAERETAALNAQVTALDATREQVEAAHARARELSALARELETAQAMAEAWTAVEWALQRIRERDLASRGGPLIERMDRFLAAAGRSERAYLRAGKGRVDFGWRRGDAEIPIEALSGGETVLAVTALAGAVLALRAPALRVLLIEAAELGIDHAGALMAGCDALGEDVGNVAVFTCLPVEAREGWQQIEVAAKAMAGAAA